METKINITSNNCASPLIVKWDGAEYKVNKPLDQSGVYVDKAIADSLYEALVYANKLLREVSDAGHYPESALAENGGDGLAKITQAIRFANGSN